MDRDDVIRMAREAGMSFHLGMPHEKVAQQLGRFADLVTAQASIKAAQMLASGLREAVAAEREQCANVADDYSRVAHVAQSIASAIRQRGSAD